MPGTTKAFDLDRNWQQIATGPTGSDRADARIFYVDNGPHPACFCASAEKPKSDHQTHHTMQPRTDSTFQLPKDRALWARAEAMATRIVVTDRDVGYIEDAGGGAVQL